jgi:hypothetical protein
MEKVDIGFIGWRNIGDACRKAAAKFPSLDIRGVVSANQVEPTGARQWTC